MRKWKSYALRTYALGAACAAGLLPAREAHAAVGGCSAMQAGGGGSALPWESPLCTIQESPTGPTAYAISLSGVAVAGGMLIFGGEINEFARRIVMLVLVIALLLGASSVLSTLNIGGALIQ